MAKNAKFLVPPEKNSLINEKIIHSTLKIEFLLPSLLDIEVSGPDKRTTTIHSLYTRSVARNVVTKTNNKSTADLIKCRSQDFMIELGKSSPVNFFNRFKMHLSQELNIDIEADFSCKWSIIEQ